MKEMTEIKVDNDRILWLKEKHEKEGLDHKYLQEITTKYHSNHRKHRYELDIKSRKQNFHRWKICNQSDYGL